MVDTVKGFVYKINMTKKTDGRTKRGEVRRMAWRHVAEGAEADDASDDVAFDGDGALTVLYHETRSGILKWMRARSRGVMGPPPGGVGTK